MKNKYKVLPYCIKHKLHHGQKYPSCILQKKEQIQCGFSVTVPSGARVNFEVIGSLRTKDIIFVYKLLKLQHNPYL